MGQETSEVFYDFDLLIRSSSMNLFSVSLVAENGKKVAEGVFQHFESLKDMPAALGKARTSDPADVPNMYDKLKDFGERLYEALIAGKIGREVGRLKDVGGQVALRFRIEPHELQQVPWESLYDGSEFVAASRNVVISRIPLGTQKSDKPVLKTTPNVACIFVRPFLEEYGDEKRWESRMRGLNGIFEEVSNSGAYNIEMREVTTLDDIRSMLADDKYEIIHIFSQCEDQRVLLAEGELISASALTAELSSLINLRFAVLTSVFGRNLALGEMGRDLVLAKVPGVLVMPLEMGQKQEKAFLTTLYQSVATGRRLDYSVSFARRAVLDIGETRADFMIPFFLMSMAQPFNPPAPSAKTAETKSADIGTVRARLLDIISKEQGAAKALAHATLALLQQNEGEYDLALENYRLAVPIFEKEGDKGNLATAFNNIATILMERAEFENAVEPLTKCISLRKEFGQAEEAVIASKKLGYSYQKLGKLSESVDSYRDAFDLALKLDDKTGVCDAYFDLGTSLHKMGELEQAAEILGKSVEKAKELDDKTRITDALEYLGAVHFDFEDYSKAKEAYEQCRDIRMNDPDKEAAAMTLSNLGNVELRLDNAEEARKLYQQAVEMHLKYSSRTGFASSLHNLARAQYKLGEHLEAVCSALKAKNTAVEGSIGDVEHLSSELLEQIKVEVGNEKYDGLLKQAQEKMA